MEQPGPPSTLGERAPDESRALTGLRAVAALLVMLHHFYLQLALHEHLPMIQWLLRKGYLGVDLFFVLSGFVMAMVYGPWFSAARRPGGATYMRFIARRVARLWPLHATVLLIVLLTNSTLPYLHVTPAMLLANVAMIQAWGVSAAINAPAWSVSTEFLAYLCFPMLAAPLLRGPRGPWLALLCVVAAYGTCLQLAPAIGEMRRGRLDLYFNYSLLPPLRCLAGFMLGMLAWRAGQVRWVRALTAARWFGPAMLLMVVAMLLGRVNDLIIVAAVPPLVLGLHYGRGPGYRLLASGPLHALGVLSYATYLTHFALLRLFPFGGFPLRYLLPIYILATILIAAALHRLVEQPGRRLLRVWSDSAARMLHPPAPAAAGTQPPLQDGLR